MNLRFAPPSFRLAQRVGFAVITAAVAVQTSVAAEGYHQINLVSNIDGVARHTNLNLVNPWGLTFSSQGKMVVSANGTGYLANSTLSNNPQQNLVTIPLPVASTGTAGPTGVVYNPTQDFVLSDGVSSMPARYIAVTTQGLIVGYNPELNATTSYMVVDNSASGAVYTGVAFAQSGHGNFVYAANFSGGTVDMYAEKWAFVRTITDPNIPAGYSPFNLQVLGDNLYVAYAQVDPLTGEEMKGAGLGYVSVFTLDGQVEREIIQQGALNAPWGMALAPAGFGTFGGALLVGNFGDGWINAFDPSTGTFLGSLSDNLGNPIAIDGLWGITFRGNKLYFAAGIDDEVNGLVGFIRP